MLPADFELPKHYQPQFTSNMERLLRIGGSVLEPFCGFGTYHGESAEVVKQFGKGGARVGNEDRYGDTPIRTTPRDQRWVGPTTIDTGDLFDKEDDLRQLVDPSSQILAGFRDDLGEALDEEVIVPAFFGNAMTGKNGLTAKAWPGDANSDIAVTVGSANGATAVGMNVAKLRAVRKLLKKGGFKFGSEPVYCGITALAEEQLTADEDYKSRLYGEPVLDSGKLKNFLGFTFVEYEMFPLGAGATADVRYLPVWVKSGMHVGTWMDVVTRLGPDTAKKFNIRAYVAQMKGCTRTQEAKVKRIACADTEH